MENYTIYKFTFSDGKTYIGQTKEKIEDRWKNGEGYKGQDVYVPIVLEGWDNIKKEILHTNLTAEQADKLEKFYIKKFNSKNNGYNRTDGGGARKAFKINNPRHLEELTIVSRKKTTDQYGVGKWGYFSFDETFYAWKDLKPASFALYLFLLRDQPNYNRSLYKVEFEL